MSVRRMGPGATQAAGRVRTMPEESTLPDLVERTRRWVEAASYDEWAAFAEQYLAADAVWDGGKIARIAMYTDIEEARTTAERLAQERR